MKLIKTEMSGISYTENKNKTITYYGNFRHPLTKKPTRKKLLTKDKHLKKNNREALEKLNKIIEEIKESNNSNIILNNNNEIKNYLTINELADSHFTIRKELAIKKLKEDNPSITDEDFFQHAKVKAKMKNLMKDVYTYNKHIRNSCVGDVAVNKIDVNLKDEFLLNIDDRLSKKSKFNVFSIVKTVINKGKERSLITVDNIFANDKTITNPKRQRSRVLNEEQLSELLTKCYEYTSNPNVYLSVYFATLTGARSNTILNLRVKDIDIENRIIYLDNFKASRKYKQVIDQNQIDYIKNQILPNYSSKDEYILRHNNPNKRKLEPMSRIPEKVYEIMDINFNEDINKQDNIERDSVLNFHSIRRSVATNLAKNGTSLYNVMIFLNHSNIEQTMKYLNLTNNDLQKGVTTIMNSIFKSIDLENKFFEKEMVVPNYREEEDKEEMKKLDDSIRIREDVKTVLNEEFDKRKLPKKQIFNPFAKEETIK
ncbi:tyrosine-type recombinase/integrase [Arcobacter sp. YIC-310]|uniref:tyrosine-type recombinase/integrase n=1 Tax=Arcobacter sp. YIC-310 TaxID=3376632 RepID=UPI003C1EA844